VLPWSIIPSSSVSVHYLGNGCLHSTQIWHMDMSKECKFKSSSKEVMVWWFLAQLCSFNFEKKRRNIYFMFLFIISPTVVHIQP
jgi:hypothetical protein